MKIVVAGNGMVGQKLLEEIASQPDIEVTVLCEEPRAAYDRVHLSEFFSGKTAEDLSLVSEGFFDQPNLNLKLNTKAVSVDTAAKTVSTADGQEIAYDKLVLATGSYPFVPPVPGRDRGGCMVYRTIEDLEAMKAWGAKSRKGVVVGGGLLGLECAKALKDMGLETHVVEFAPRLMTMQVDDMGGALVRATNWPGCPGSRWASVVVSLSIITARPATRMSTPSANVPCGKDASSVWWHRATTWPESARSTCWVRPRRNSPARTCPPNSSCRGLRQPVADGAQQDSASRAS